MLFHSYGIRVTLGGKSCVGNDLIGFDVLALRSDVRPFQERVLVVKIELPCGVEAIWVSLLGSRTI